MDLIHEIRLAVADKYITEYSKQIDNFSYDKVKCELETGFIDKYLYFYEAKCIFEIHITNNARKKEFTLLLNF